ncbi:hypothetical protein [Glaesserella parasuis]|uniref:hypothetical protein n=1 Tax=Glaesserella parasuis TaxID=738 RepID=UPI0004E84126|nr:hypothetical protein JL26_02445 [Glaesserella parasuis]
MLFGNKCYKIFILKNKLDPIKIWTYYTSGIQTYQQLAVKSRCSVRTIQRYQGYFPYKHRNVGGCQSKTLDGAIFYL